jgi:hypothetical protein
MKENKCSTKKSVNKKRILKNQQTKKKLKKTKKKLTKSKVSNLKIGKRVTFLHMRWQQNWFGCTKCILQNINFL